MKKHKTETETSTTKRQRNVDAAKVLTDAQLDVVEGGGCPACGQASRKLQ